MKKILALGLLLSGISFASIAQELPKEGKDSRKDQGKKEMVDKSSNKKDKCEGKQHKGDKSKKHDGHSKGAKDAKVGAKKQKSDKVVKRDGAQKENKGVDRSTNKGSGRKA